MRMRRSMCMHARMCQRHAREVGVAGQDAAELHRPLLQLQRQAVAVLRQQLLDAAEARRKRREGRGGRRGRGWGEETWDGEMKRGMGKGKI